MVSKRGLTISTRTFQWLELLVVLVSVGTPCVAYILKVRDHGGDIARLQDTDKAHAEAISALETKVEQKMDKIDQRLHNIEAAVNKIAGKLEGVTRIGSGQ